MRSILLSSPLVAVQDRVSSNPMSSFFFILIAASVAYQVAVTIYNLFFHPLRKFPGSTLCAASKIPLVCSMMNGSSHKWTHAMHLKYGPVIRMAPNMLSFTDERAWKDIHGFKKPVPFKDPEAYGVPPNKVPGMLTAADEPHARVRRIFAHAFSDKALKEQEPLFSQYIDLLVNKLKDGANANPDGNVDMVRMLNFTTFDIMGDLTFGEPLGLLEKTDYIPWVSLIFASLKFGTYMRALRLFPLLKYTLNLWTPRALAEKRNQHFQYSSDRVTKRLEAKVERPDIWGLVLKQQEQGRGISLKEMHSNAALFMGAGTETTATELSGMLYHLLKNPSKMANLVQEVRTSFHNDDEISMERISQLEYLHACLEEGLRLYPPVPIGLPRVIPAGGTTIADYLVPAGSSVCITQFATYRSPLNFKAPDSFIPERWLSSSSDQTFASDVKSALQPFSYGPRNCLGKNMAYHEMRLVLTKLLWNFDFELCEESKSWAESQKVFALWEKMPLLVKVKAVKR